MKGIVHYVIKTIGDEYHFLLECKELKMQRDCYIPKYNDVRPNTLKFNRLLTNKKGGKLNLAKFIKNV